MRNFPHGSIQPFAGIADPDGIICKKEDLPQHLPWGTVAMPRKTCPVSVWCLSVCFYDHGAEKNRNVLHPVILQV